MNSFVLKIGKTAELPEPLEIGTEYTVTVTGEVTGISKDDNQDGSFTFTHKMDLKAAHLIQQGGKIIHTKDSRKQSQKLRAQITALGLDYDQTMVNLRRFLPELLNFITKLKDDENP